MIEKKIITNSLKIILFISLFFSIPAISFAMERNIETDFFNAINKGDLGAVEKIFATDPTVAAKTDWSEFTPLMEAASRNNPAIVTFLLESNCCPNEQDDLGITPLQLAAASGQEENVKILLAAKANVNLSSDDNNESPLIAAARNGHNNIMRRLLSAGANKDQQESEKGLTALMIAVKFKHKESIKLLCKAGVSKKLQTKGGWTALDIAQSYQDPNLIKLLSDIQYCL
jgi:uncharacterized protein